MKVKRILNIKRYKAGYEVREEVVDLEGRGSDDNDELTMYSAYSPRGEYIGGQEEAYFLCVERGIMPETTPRRAITPGKRTCSIGYSYKDGKWYGWSHRAIVGFDYGDMIFEEDFGDDQTPYIKHGTKEIVTLSDARLAAIRFARSVS
jgi:hypothetical protein